MVGIATLMMLMSSTDMNMPTISTASGTPQPRSDGGGVGAAGAGGAGAAARGTSRSATGVRATGVGAASVAISRVSHDGMNRTALGPTRLSIIAATPLTAGHGLRRSAYIGH